MDNTPNDKLQAIGNAYFHPSYASLEGMIDGADGTITAYFETITQGDLDHEKFSFPAEYLDLDLPAAEISKMIGKWYSEKLNGEYQEQAKKDRYAQYLRLKEEFGAI